MNTKLLLGASAIVMGAAGLAASFAPDEIAATLGLGSAALLIQLLGALLFAFAMVNWLARGSLIGGIYNRPVAVGNIAHFVIGALALSKAVAAGERHPVFVAATVLYILFTLGFASLLFRSPVQRS